MYFRPSTAGARLKTCLETESRIRTFNPIWLVFQGGYPAHENAPGTTPITPAVMVPGDVFVAGVGTTLLHYNCV